MSNQSIFPTSSLITPEFKPEAKLVLHQGYVADFLATIPDESISLIVTSPPYNIGKNYEKRTDITDYLDQQSTIIEQLIRVLKEDGSICWQVGNYVDKGEVFPLDIFYYQIFKKYNLFLRNRIIWHFGHGLHASKRFSGRYETILWFTKSKDYVFNLDAVRVPAKYPGKRHYKGKNKGKLSGNPQGKNPSDLWQIAGDIKPSLDGNGRLEHLNRIQMSRPHSRALAVDEWAKEVWEIPNVKSNHPEKTIHPCQYPVELVERCVLALTDEGDRVFDPFAGVGSSLIAAIKHNRCGIGCEKEAEYIAIAKERLAAYFKGTLRTREMGKPVYQPTGRDKVSQVPKEWKKPEAQQMNLFEKKGKY